ncbi:hypothetical protein BCR34DRAFT_501194, partial [Clohesyomyces aquaticus]
ISIITIHGLSGDSFSTWTKGSAWTSCLWLKDLLPKSLEELKAQARIFTFGYNADLFANLRAGRSNAFARDLLVALTTKRELTNTTRRPLIMIAHSLGGIVLKAVRLAPFVSRSVASNY